MSLWDRQPDEPAMWFDRFDRLYRPQGPSRSLLAAFNAWQREVGKSKTKCPANAWILNSQKWQWQQRAELWDEYERQERLRIEEEERREMTRRHIQQSLEMQSLGRYVLRQELRMAQENGPIALEAKDARQFIKDGIALERLARGLPEWLINITQLSDAELLERYAQLTADANESEQGIGNSGDTGDVTAPEHSDTAETE